MPSLPGSRFRHGCNPRGCLPSASLHHLLHHVLHASTTATAILRVPHLLHHIHQVPHAAELLYQLRVDSLAHLLHHTLRVALELLHVCVIIEAHFAKLFNHSLELVVLLDQEYDLLGACA